MSEPEVSVPASTSPYGAIGKQQTLREIPVDLIQGLASEHDRVMITIQRRNNKGQAASLGYNGVTMETLGLISIADWIQPRAGGGVYMITVLDRRDGRSRLIPPFEVIIEGAAREPIPLNMPAPVIPGGAGPFGPLMPPPMFGPPMGGFMPPPPPPFVLPDLPPETEEERAAREAHHRAPRQVGVPLQHPRDVMTQPWIKHLSPEQEAVYRASAMYGYQGYGMPPAPGATMASDQLAAEQLRKAEARNAELQTKLDNIMQRFDEAQRSNERMLREITDKHREETWQLRLEAVKASSGTSSKPQLAEYAAALAPFAPVFAAFVTAQKESSSRALEVQQSGLTRLMEMTVSQANRPQPDPLSIIEKLGPILGTNRDNASGQAAMLEAMNNMQLSQLSLVAQVLETLAANAPQESPAMQIVQQVLGGLQGMAQAYQADQQRQILAGSPPPRALAMQAGPQQQPQAPAPQAGYHTVEAPTQPQAPMAPIPATRAGGLNPAMLNLLPAEYRTPEWKTIIVKLHEKLDPEKLGMLFAMHLEHLVAFDMLPNALAKVLEDPQGVLGLMLQQLPIYTSDRDYCTAVVEATTQAMLELELIASEEEDEGDEGDEDEGDEETPDEAAPEEQA